MSMKRVSANEVDEQQEQYISDDDNKANNSPK